jgi:hypothetical protein
MTERVVVLRLVGGSLEGCWMAVREPPAVVYFLPVNRTTQMVPSGSVEWDGDRCAEVYVPEHLLAYWHAEHDLEAS